MVDLSKSQIRSIDIWDQIDDWDTVDDVVEVECDTINAESGGVATCVIKHGDPQGQMVKQRQKSVAIAERGIKTEGGVERSESRAMFRGLSEKTPRTHYEKYRFEDGAECQLVPGNRSENGKTVTDDSESYLVCGTDMRDREEKDGRVVS